MSQYPDNLHDITKKTTPGGTNSGEVPKNLSMQVDKQSEFSAVAQQLLKKIDSAQARLNEIHCNNAGDIYIKKDRSAADEAFDTVEWLSKQISITTKRVDSKARPVNLGEIPRFQLTGQRMHRPNLTRFSTMRSLL